MELEKQSGTGNDRIERDQMAYQQNKYSTAPYLSASSASGRTMLMVGMAFKIMIWTCYSFLLSLHELQQRSTSYLLVNLTHIGQHTRCSPLIF